MKKLSVFLLFIVAGFYAGAQSTPKEKPELGNNIVTMTPMQIISNEAMNDGTDIGLGLAYERILSNGLISVKLPVVLSIRNPGFFYFMPSIKLYPTHQGVVRYAVGPQFYVASGNIKHRNYHSYWNGNQYISEDISYTDSRTQLGFLINNTLNITISKSIYIGMELGLGVNYFDSKENDNRNNYNTMYSDGIQPRAQFNFNMGYRF
jgi:hypothetical protein